MKLLGQDNDNIIGQCEKCNKVMNIRRANLWESDSAFIAIQPFVIKCVCGQIYESILKTTISNKPNDEKAKGDGGCGCALIVAIFLILALIGSICDTDSDLVPVSKNDPNSLTDSEYNYVPYDSLSPLEQKLVIKRGAKEVDEYLKRGR